MNKYKRPEEFESSEPKTFVSARIKAADKEFLTKEAKRAKKSLSELVGDVLQDYAEWLRKES